LTAEQQPPLDVSASPFMEFFILMSETGVKLCKGHALQAQHLSGCADSMLELVQCVPAESIPLCKRA
jgi:hypothetical protein